MTIEFFLISATRFVLVLLALVTMVDYWRYRDATRLDIALLFSSLGYVGLVQIVSQLLNFEARWLSVSTQVALLAYPYLALRLVEDFRLISWRVKVAAAAGMLLSWSIVIFLPSPFPPLGLVIIIGYFVAVGAYAALAFIRGAFATSGVSQQRLLFAAAGSALLAAVILFAGLALLQPNWQPFTTPVQRLAALLAVLSYYVGFAPPRRLRRAWQLSELHNFLNHAIGPWMGEQRHLSLERLCDAAMRAVGGTAAVATLWDDDSQQLVPWAAIDPENLFQRFPFNSRPVTAAWANLTPALVPIHDNFALHDNPALEDERLGVGFLMPMRTKERGWGVLLVFARRPSLFASDDLALLELFAEQTAVAVAYTSLLDEQETLINRLRQQTTRLETAYQELETFSYSVSHDLRAPLRHIVGYVELLQKRTANSLDGKSEHYLSVILESTNRMGNLIDALLASSRIGRVDLDRRKVDLGQLVRDIISEFEPESRDRDINWKINRLPAVYGDYSLLRLVLANLVSNALKFTRSRQQAEIEIGSLPNEDKHLIFVRDNGVGFDMSYANQLFGVFKRLHSSKEFEGTGIGLANVRRALNRHGGSVWADGAIDSGATFYFTLPKTNGENKGAERT